MVTQMPPKKRNEFEDEEDFDRSSYSGNPQLGRREHEVTKSDISYISYVQPGNTSMIKFDPSAQGPAPTTPVQRRKWDETSNVTHLQKKQMSIKRELEASTSDISQIPT